MDFGEKPFHRSVSALFPATIVSRTSTLSAIIPQAPSAVKNDIVFPEIKGLVNVTVSKHLNY